MLTKEMNEMKDAREKSEKELEILHEKKATHIGNFCSSCNEPLMQKQTSNKCKKCYKNDRNQTRLSERAMKPNNPVHAVSILKKKLRSVRARLYRLINKSDLAKKSLAWNLMILQL